MGAVDTSTELPEEGNHTALKLGTLGSLHDFLKLTQEQNLLQTISQGPKLEQASDNDVCQLEILLHKLDYTIGELLVVHGNTLGFVQGQKRTHEEELVLLLERQSEPVHNASENLQKLSNAAMLLSLVDKTVEDVVDSLANERTVHHEFPVNSMQYGLEILALSGILGIEPV